MWRFAMACRSGGAECQFMGILSHSMLVKSTDAFSAGGDQVEKRERNHVRNVGLTYSWGLSPICACCVRDCPHDVRDCPRAVFACVTVDCPPVSSCCAYGDSPCCAYLNNWGQSPTGMRDTLNWSASPVTRPRSHITVNVAEIGGWYWV